jgi:hypothetical protein
MKVNGKDDIPYMKWKIKAMFETTNQSSESRLLRHMFYATGNDKATRHG